MKLVILLLWSCAWPAQSWLQFGDLPDQGRDDGAAVTVNNVAFFGSGLKTNWTYGNDFYRLDPITNSWTAIAAMPAGAQRQYACAFAGTGCFYVFGGDGVGGPLSNLYKYDLATDSWQAMASKPGAGLLGGACLEFGDKIIIVGGRPQGNAPASNEVWQYTISSDSWQQKSNLPFGGRFRAGGTVYNGQGYLMAGLDENNRFCREMYRYDPVADSWTLISTVAQPGRAYAALRTVSNQLVWFGGADSTMTHHKDLWYFNPASSSWSPGPDLPSFGRRGGMSAVIGSRFYYSGGIDANNVRLSESWVLELPVSLAEQADDNKNRLYPNPVSDLLYFELQKPNAGYATLDFVLVSDHGHTAVRMSQRGQQLFTLAIGHLAPGLYTLNVYLEKKWIACRRIIKD